MPPPPSPVVAPTVSRTVKVMAAWRPQLSARRTAAVVPNLGHRLAVLPLPPKVFPEKAGSPAHAQSSNMCRCAQACMHAAAAAARTRSMHCIGQNDTGANSGAQDRMETDGHSSPAAIFRNMPRQCWCSSHELSGAHGSVAVFTVLRYPGNEGGRAE